MQRFQKIKVWEKSHKVTMDVYAFTRNFPSDERYGLISQMRRSAASIPANIAEGSSRKSQRDFARFLEISMGSSKELEYHIFLSWKLGYLSDEHYESASQELLAVQNMLGGFIRELHRQGHPKFE